MNEKYKRLTEEEVREKVKGLGDRLTVYSKEKKILYCHCCHHELKDGIHYNLGRQKTDGEWSFFQSMCRSCVEIVYGKEKMKLRDLYIKDKGVSGPLGAKFYD